jgi:hypothetical protein
VRHRVLRAMAALAAGINLLSIAHGAILVLFAQERLGLGSVGLACCSPPAPWVAWSAAWSRRG